MSSVVHLTIGTKSEPLLSFVNRYDVPLLWACGFVGSELRRSTVNSDDGEDESTFYFESTAGEVRRRFETIARSLDTSGSEYVREVWAGCIVVLQLLAALPDDSAAVLDPNEAAAMASPGSIEADLLHRMMTFAELRETWDPELAHSMTQVIRRDVLTGALPADRTRARRAMRVDNHRAGFFAMTFGAVQGKHAAPIEEWLASAPRGEPLRPLAEDAALLADALISHGVIELPQGNRSRAMSFLALAAQFRSTDALQTSLDVLFGQGVVGVGTVVPVRWRELDRIIGPEQANEVPVFAEDVLGSVVSVLGD